MGLMVGRHGGWERKGVRCGPGIRPRSSSRLHFKEIGSSEPAA